MQTPDTCPNCGADVPTGARACPECGADEHTGWSDEARASGLDLPDDSFDYDTFVEREFPSGKKPIPYGIHWGWWVVTIALLTLFIVGMIRLTS